jgi:Flp pilus assembly secretin CpaC
MFCASAVVLAVSGFLAVSPTGAPAEAIGEMATIKLQSGRSLVLRPKADVDRTAIAAEGIVELVQLTPREIMLIGGREGTTTATFWFTDPALPPVTYAIEVASAAPASK